MINKLTFGSNFQLEKRLAAEQGYKLREKLGISPDGVPTKACPYEIASPHVSSADTNTITHIRAGIGSVTSILDDNDDKVLAALDEVGAEITDREGTPSINYYTEQLSSRANAQGFIDSFR